MGAASIPVEVTNPGQVFACLGFLEAAEALCGPAEGGFVWQEGHEFEVQLHLAAANADDPVACVLEFLAHADAIAFAPKAWTSPKQAKGNDKKKSSEELERVDHSPGAELGDMALPIMLAQGGTRRFVLSHWADGSSRDDFKLYSGNRSALSIARTMLRGKLTKKGKVELQGIAQLWADRKEDLVTDPFGTVVPMGGSFNFDARCAWQAIDAGYSPDAHSQRVYGSPVVELLAAWGLENARPQHSQHREYRYSIWREPLPPSVARPSLAGAVANVPCRHFWLRLGLSGKNKVVRYAEEET